MSFKASSGVMKWGSEVEIPPSAADLPELGLLASLGWYMLIIQMRDASAAATNAIVSSYRR